MSKYLVGLVKQFFEEEEVGEKGNSGNDTLFLIDAPNKKEAIAAFYNYFSTRDSSFLNYIYGKNRLLFDADLWLQTEEEKNYCDQYGDVLINNSIFMKRVNIYFADHPHFANIYMQYYFDDKKDSTNFNFPEEMIRFIWFKEYNDGWCSVTAIRLSKLPKLHTDLATT